jgi:RNA recognition motif-containing protein
MAKRLFVGGLPWAVTDQKLEEIFSQHGAVSSAKVITDKFTGRSKGFGFVEYANDEDADKAIKALDGSEMEGRKIVVNVARPLEERSNDRPRSGGFNDRGGDRGGDRRGGFRSSRR